MAARALLICMLVLAAAGLRAPDPDIAGNAIAESSAIAHDHGAHTHDDGGTADRAGAGHDHRIHAGDHSHDMPTFFEPNRFTPAGWKVAAAGSPPEIVLPAASLRLERPPRAIAAA